MIAAAWMAWALSAKGLSAVYAVIPIFLIGLFFGCVVCHGELARAKPAPAFLTHFYVSLALGGALGGLFVGLLAPRVFDSYWEMPITLIGLTMLGVRAWLAEPRERSRHWTLIVAALLVPVILGLVGRVPVLQNRFILEIAKIILGDARWGCGALLVLTVILLERYRLAPVIAFAALATTLVFCGDYYIAERSGAQVLARNFYGTLRVRRCAERVVAQCLDHGVILHGSQMIPEAQRQTPTTYYGHAAGIGQVLLLAQENQGALRVGSIGLGAGTLAAYGRSGDLYRIYEINPAVVTIARNQFSYLSDSPATVETVLGDARLSLERAISKGEFATPEQRYDVLSVDAFSGDAIPTHLLSREAFAVYARVTKADGIIAFHVSNSYLDLAPVVEEIARDAGYRAVLVSDRPHQPSVNRASDWVLVSRNTVFLDQPEIRLHSVDIPVRPGLRLWTDQFSNLFQILK
jgi:hypothetical protein